MDKDREILRKLAFRRMDLCSSAEMDEKRASWKRHNSLADGARPMVLCFPEGAWSEILPDSTLECADPFARELEYKLRSDIYTADYLQDDQPFEPYFQMNWIADLGNYGVKTEFTYGENKGSYHIEHPVKDIATGLSMLRDREFRVDRDATYQRLDTASRYFGDILPVVIRGGFIWSYGLTQDAIHLVGLENFMLAMYDAPESLHQLMRFLSDQHLRMIDFFEKEELFTLNNRADYVSSGGIGYTDELPSDGLAASGKVTAKDLWCLSESQETVGVSPQMFSEFVLPYQRPVMDRFGLVCYGCCEPIDKRWDYVRTIPNLRRVSVSPWCDQEFMGDALKGKAIFSRKPNPTLLCTGLYDEIAIRKDIRGTLAMARGCRLEIISKDTHTVQNRPERLKRWVELVREEFGGYPA